MAAKSFHDLLVWQQSMQLVQDVYEVAATLPPDERFGLAAQMKRAVVSLPCNIAEGVRRRRRLSFRYHVEVAPGSRAELEVQMELARRLGFIDEARYRQVSRKTEAVGKMLSGLLSSL